MKLYTEEQVIQAFKDGFITAINEGTYDYVNEYMNELTSIKLSYDEIEFLSNHPEVLSLDYIDGFMDGTWWVKEKILNQNK